MILLPIILLLALTPYTVSTKCSDLLKHFGDFREQWFLKMVDASAKIPSGLMEGNMVEIGSFDGCMKIDEKSSDGHAVQGKYCFTKGTIQMVPSMPVSLGVCIPKVCKAEEVEATWNLAVGRIFQIEYKFDDSVCKTKDLYYSKLVATDWVFVSFLVVIALIIIISTLFDIRLQRRNEKPQHPLLIAFSALTNGQKLMAISNNPSMLPCLNGIRVLSMLWVLLGHRYSLRIIPFINTIDSFEWMRTLKSYYIQGSTVSVDSFFTIGGLLVTYTFLRVMEKENKFNILLYYAHRYLRLTPIVLVVVLFNMTLVDKMGSGPFWQLDSAVNCREYFWSSALYVQNYVNPKELCLTQTWYLSADFQLYLLTPFILIPLKKWPKYTLPAIFILIVGGFVSPFSIMLEMGTHGVSDYLDDTYYLKTHARFGPYVIGMLTGYLIFETKKNNELLRKVPKRTMRLLNLIGWLLVVVTTFAVVFGSYNMNKHDFDKYERAFFEGFHRNAWAIALSFVAFSCIHGYGGVVNRFLSWSPFQVLGKLTYTMYLTHATIQTMMDSQMRVPKYFSDLNYIYDFFGDFWLTLGVSVVFCLAFELPMLTIEKVLLK